MNGLDHHGALGAVFSGGDFPVDDEDEALARAKALKDIGRLLAEIESGRDREFAQ